jgi:KDO2-lipid IV(A) lauroyltransferase
MRIWLINSVMRVFSLITPRAANRIAPVVAAILWHTNARRRGTTLRNVELCYPDLDVVQRQMLARESLVHYVRNIFEAGMAWFWPEDRLMALFEPAAGQQHMDDARAKGHGVIVAAPHFGSWELCNLFLRREFDGAVLYKQGRNADFDALLLQKRSRTGIDMVPANHRGLRAIYTHLKNSRAVGILPDQEPSFGEGEFAPLMGVDALTGVLIPRLIQKTGARVVFVACERLETGRYRVHFLPAEEAIDSAGITESLQAMNRGVEQCIAIAPAQYLWSYKRFRHRPEGEPPIY